MEQMHFTYNPLHLTRLFLQMYVEKYIEGKFYKAKQFACYEYLDTLEDEELECVLLKYTKEFSVEEITFSDLEEECGNIFKVIYELDRYKKLEFNFKKAGYGTTGYGVVDKSDSTFYDCAFLGHWEKVKEVIKENHHKMHEALDEMEFREDVREFNGVKRKELDSFILENFELVGQRMNLDYYVESR